MIKKALDEKYSYQIDEHNVVHLFRGEEGCQHLLTNPLLSAIFKIEELEKEITELKGEADSVLDNWCKGDDPCPHLKKRDGQLIKAKEIIKYLCKMARELDKPNPQSFNVDYSLQEAEQFLKELSK